MSWKRAKCYLGEAGFSCCSGGERLTCGKSGLDSVKYCAVWEENPVSDEELCWLVPLGVAKESFLFVRPPLQCDWQCLFLNIPWKSLRTCLEERCKYRLGCLSGASFGVLTLHPDDKQAASSEKLESDVRAREQVYPRLGWSS